MPMDLNARKVQHIKIAIAYGDSCDIDGFSTLESYETLECSPDIPECTITESIKLNKKPINVCAIVESKSGKTQMDWPARVQVTIVPSRTNPSHSSSKYYDTHIFLF